MRPSRSLPRVFAARVFAAQVFAAKVLAARVFAAKVFAAQAYSGTGPSMAVLRSVVRRMAAVVRAFGASYVVVQVAIWHVYFAAHPWLLAGPLAAVA